jgi:hypothetical protein
MAMAMAILTCVNHPNLRWSCKDEAITMNSYNGQRSLFFNGEPTGEGMYQDGSGLHTSKYFKDRADPVVRECSCNTDCLVLAPENKLVKR